jgi:flagellar assembly factor FliW
MSSHTAQAETRQIVTKRFGTVTVSEDEQFAVPRGIPGFATMRRAVLLAAGSPDACQLNADEHSLFWLQDLDDGNLAFLCVVPWGLFRDYDLEIDEEEFGIDDSVDVRVLNLVTVDRSGAQPTLSVNLRAPIIVDVRRRQLFQTILADARWPITADLPPAVCFGAQ